MIRSEMFMRRYATPLLIIRMPAVETAG
jgi:hypothetical protein